MKSKAILLIAMGLLAGPLQANADIVWDWSFAGESGTFTTTGSAPGGAAAAGSYVLSDFSVDSSGSSGQLGSASGGQWTVGSFDYVTAAPFTLQWDGSTAVEWDNSTPDQYNWWLFQNTSDADDLYLFGYAADNVNDPTSGAHWNARTGDAGASFGTITVAPSSVPEPATLTLLGMGLAGLGMMRKRKQV